jgi:hypothetical protein
MQYWQEPVRKTMSTSNRLSGAALLVSAALAAYGLALLAVPFLPPGLLVGDLRQFAGGGGDPAAIVAARFGTIASHARLAGAALVALALLTGLFRRHIGAWLASRLQHQNRAAWRAGTMAHAVMQACSARPWAVGVAVLVFVSGCALRLAYLGRAMRHDEAWTYMFYARMPAYLIPIRYSEVNDHVLNTLLVHFSTALFGDAPHSVRLPALLFGIACIPAGYGLARALAGSGAAVIAAALIATATPLVEFSVNARGYTALTCFFLCALWAGHIHRLRRLGPLYRTHHDDPAALRHGLVLPAGLVCWCQARSPGFGRYSGGRIFIGAGHVAAVFADPRRQWRRPAGQ